MPPISIYIASSFRHVKAVQKLRDTLQEKGFLLFDWTALAKPIPEGLSPEERKKLFDSDERKEIFDFCTQACGQVDLVIYLGQAGQDAATEVGMSFAAGVPVYGLLGKDEKPGLILGKSVSKWFKNEKDLLEEVQEFRFNMEFPE